MLYTQPIFDRTKNDVEYALSHQNDSLDLKGALNVSDLIRIDNNTIFLQEALSGQGYAISIQEKTNWTDTTPITLAEIDRIKQNCVNLINGFSEYNNTPTLTLGIEYLHYETINDVEKIIYDINDLYNNLVSCFYICGVYKLGDYNLPLTKNFYNTYDYLSQFTHKYLSDYTHNELRGSDL